MRDHRPTLTEDIISKSKLSDIQKHAAQLHRLNKTVIELLPKDIQRYCRVANCRGGQLIVEVANASIKMKLNYDRLHLLSQLRKQGFASLINIEINVRPELYINAPALVKEPAIKRPPLSQAAADNLNMLAEMAPDKIKKRLQNIAKLAQK